MGGFLGELRRRKAKRKGKRIGFDATNMTPLTGFDSGPELQPRRKSTDQSPRGRIALVFTLFVAFLGQGGVPPSILGSSLHSHTARQPARYHS